MKLSAHPDDEGHALALRVPREAGPSLWGWGRRGHGPGSHASGSTAATSAAGVAMEIAANADASAVSGTLSDPDVDLNMFVAVPLTPPCERQLVVLGD